MTKAKEFRDQSTEELNANCSDLRKEQFELVNGQQQSKKLEKPHRITEIRRDVARIKTILNERERQDKLEGTS